MNTIVSQMPDTTVRRDTEISNLEEVFHEDCKCESSHQVSKCTVEVTHLVYSRCGVYGRLHICDGAAKSFLAHMKNPVGLCAGCGRIASVCWVIIPI